MTIALIFYFENHHIRAPSIIQSFPETIDISDLDPDDLLDFVFETTNELLTIKYLQL